MNELLALEFLITNGRGGYASGTVIGCSTRRQHGWLVASRRAPLERYVLLAGVVDRVRSGSDLIELSSWEFNHGFEPAGYTALREFDYELSSPDPWVQWTFELSGVTVRRRLTIVSDRPMLRIRYDVDASPEREVALEVSPLLALRDFHGLRREAAFEPWETVSDGATLWVRDCHDAETTLALFPWPGPGLAATAFTLRPVWWHNVHYREEMAREYLGGEDLQLAGAFRAQGRSHLSVELAAVGFAPGLAEAMQMAESVGGGRSATKPQPQPVEDSVRHELAVAAEQFVVRRETKAHRDQATIIAGYPWFGDWGRDAFIALEGLLLNRGRFEDARQVLHTFAGVQRNGLIPNRFDDYGGECEYNSVDASLWFVHAADVYLAKSEDRESWREFLAPTCQRVVEAFVAGTDFDIGTDDTGLVRCGNPTVQITWMDAKCGDTVFTPRHGRPVEVNALWYHALRILEERFADDDADSALTCQKLAERVKRNFAPTFWCAKTGCLYDCVRPREKDGAIRPNQIFAVSLAHSPLSAKKQAAVVDAVGRHLLTPFGLRSLAASDAHYIGACAGRQFERDRAYHNGTIWSWLIGPYVEAYLRVNGFSPESRQHARGLLQPLIDHLSEACLGTISEVFDGDAPHTPRGCFAQAWSVAELIRALDLIRS